MSLLKDLIKTFKTPSEAQSLLHDINTTNELIKQELEGANESQFPYWNAIANDNATLIYIVKSEMAIEYHIILLNDRDFVYEFEGKINEISEVKNWIERHADKVVAKGDSTMQYILSNLAT